MSRKVELKTISGAERQILKSKLAAFEISGSPHTYKINILDDEYLVILAKEQVVADAAIFNLVLSWLEEDSSSGLFMYRSIDDLGVTQDIYNLLKRNGIHTFRPLVVAVTQSRPDALLGIRNLGKKTLDALIVALVKQGLGVEHFHPSYDELLVKIYGEQQLLAMGMPANRMSKLGYSQPSYPTLSAL